MPNRFLWGLCPGCMDKLLWWVEEAAGEERAISICPVCHAYWNLPLHSVES
jgi:hypothetical protein